MGHFLQKEFPRPEKLIQKIDGNLDRVVLDDEADYATPNSKINQKEKSRINDSQKSSLGLRASTSESRPLLRGSI